MTNELVTDCRLRKPATFGRSSRPTCQITAWFQTQKNRKASLCSVQKRQEIPTHSIVAVSGDKLLAEDDDGVVNYESAHLDGVESEVVIRSWHSVQGHPLAIAEVRRILYLHGESACRSAGLCGTSKDP
jgi:hypothetical protein